MERGGSSEVLESAGLVDPGSVQTSAGARRPGEGEGVVFYTVV